ncbi:hypothetical protein M8J77_020135 [Diaphorina citri]|nr:hypothetical protein M8J77_020135 [Diaphorina citri]
MINNGSILEILLDLALENIRPDHVQMLDLAENLNLSLDIKNIIDQKPRKTVDLTVHSHGPPNPAFASHHIKTVSDVSNGFPLKEEDKFHIVLVDKPLDKFGKLLKQETEVAVVCVHPGEVFVKEDGLVEVSRMTSGGRSYSLLYRAAPWQKTTTMITVTPGKFDWVPRLQEWVSLKYTDIILINSTESEVSGLEALVKCLNQEYQNTDVRFRCVSIEDDHKPSMEDIRKQLNKNLIYNVYRQGSWGSYRHTLIDSRDVENNNAPSITRTSHFTDEHGTANNMVLFDPTKAYIVIGGLGGFGLELCDWMVQRNCRNLVLSSRSGIQTGYQQYLVNRWRLLTKVNVLVCTADVTKVSGAEELYKVASSLGPVDGVFNLAGVLRDGMFENQTADNFDLVYKTKVATTAHLDQISREHSQPLSHFVAFSSITSGRGNKGQTNYGFANRCMENICEARRRDGLSGLAIQWGPISDVGMAAKLLGQNRTKIIGGAHAQSIDSCLSSLDVLLRIPQAVVASTVLPNKNGTSGDVKQENVTVQKVIGDILGIQNITSISDSATLSDLGLDSLMAADVKNVLQSKFNISLTNEQIKELKFNAVESLLKVTP